MKEQQQLLTHSHKTPLLNSYLYHVSQNKPEQRKNINDNTRTSNNLNKQKIIILEMKEQKQWQSH